MDSSIFNMLQSKNPSEISKILLREEKRVIEWKIFQFLIDLLDSRSFELLQEDLQEALESDNDLNDLLLEVFESEKQKDETVPDQVVNEFMEKFFVNAFVADILDEDFLHNCVRFLQKIVSHPEIPSNSRFKGRSLLILSFLMCPLAQIYKSIIHNKQSVNVTENFTETVRKSLKIITKSAPKGLKLQIIDKSIVEEVTKAFEEYPTIFISDEWNNLKIYHKILLIESIPLQTAALRSLTKLCLIEEIREHLKIFFFETSCNVSEDNEKSFIELLDQLHMRQSLKLEVMSLLKEMNNLQRVHEYLSPDMRRNICLNVFSTSKRLMKQTFELMVAIDNDFMSEICSHLHEEVDLPRFVENVIAFDYDNFSFQTVGQFMVDNLKIPMKSLQAARILMQLLKSDEKQHQMMFTFVCDSLEQCLEDEDTFLVVLESFSVVDITKFFKENLAKLKLAFSNLITAFHQFSSPLTMLNIVDTLKRLTKLSPEFAVKEMRFVYQKYYRDFLNVFKEHENQRPLSQLYLIPLQKLSFLFENPNWNILEISHMETVVLINQKLCSEEIDEITPFVIRFHVNFLKHIWTRLILRRKIPFETKDVADIVITSAKFLSIVIEDKTSLADSYLLISSFLDLLVLFQPSMKDRHEAFSIVKIKLSRENVKEIAIKISKLVFEDKSVGVNAEFQRNMLLTSWISFCKNYKELPSSTASHKIIRHYRIKSPQSNQLESLMEFLMEQKTVFEQNIAFVTLDFSNVKDFNSFRAFYIALGDFLTRQFKGDIKKKILTQSTICSFILSKLTFCLSQLEDDGSDRLNVLNYVSLLMQNMSVAMKKTLEEFIPPELNNMNLNAAEIKNLTEFKKSLQE